MERPPFRCVIHGSFRKHFADVMHAYDDFTDADIEVVAPKKSDIVGFDGNFALFDGEEGMDPRLIELLYLQNLKKLGQGGFSYFVNPEGYVGKTASYELGIAQVTNVPCYFAHRLDDHPAYYHKNSVWSPENLARFIIENNALPSPIIAPNERKIHELWTDLMVPGSVVATGAIIEHIDERPGGQRDILLVKTHKWGGRYSMVGGKVKRNERLDVAMLRELKEETGLEGRIGQHICTFDQIKNSGYYMPTQHIFVDNVVHVASRNIVLNEEAQDYIWMPATQALAELPIEPNARHTIELYATQQKRAP